MTIPAQITSTGLLIPTMQEIAAALASDQKANVDPLILTDPDSVVGQINAIVASHLRSAYEAVQVAYDSLDPDNAADARLDTVSGITGTTRNPATYSTFAGTNRVLVNLNAGVTLPAGQLFSVLGTPTAVFQTTETVTNSGGAPANVAVAAKATVTGPVHANAGTATVIATPYSGWNSVTNPGDVSLGAVTEVDSALRIRRASELHKAGTSTLPALAANLLSMVSSADGITKPIISVIILENPQNIALSGVPPHGFEAVIWDGVSPAASNTDVAAVIYAAKGLGIAHSGSTGVSMKDSNGFNISIFFSRATQRPIQLQVVLQYTSGIYVGDAAVKQALSDAFQGLYGPAQSVAGVVSFSRYMALVQSLTGVVRIENWFMAFVGGSLTPFVDLTPGSREIATLSTANITVVSTAV